MIFESLKLSNPQKSDKMWDSISEFIVFYNYIYIQFYKSIY